MSAYCEVCGKSIMDVTSTAAFRLCSNCIGRIQFKPSRKKLEEKIASLEARLAEALERNVNKWQTGIPDHDDCYIGYNPVLGAIPVWFEKGKFYLYTKSNAPVVIVKYQHLPKPPEPK